MSTTVIATGFDRDWDGTYVLTYPDKWTNGTYWLYHDSYYWYISVSQYLYGPAFSKAKMVFTGLVDPKGNYDGIYGNPNGEVI